MTKKKLKDFAQQARNANKHSTRGMGMLDDVISNDGWIGAITTAADGEVFAGSARLEVACDRFGAEIEPIVIESDGTRPIVVVRTDIASASDPKAIKLGVADNRINQVNYIEDLEILGEIAEDIDLSSLYFDDELSDLLDGEDDVLGDLEGDSDNQSDNSSDIKKATLNDRFIVPPFSVLDARQGYWQERKRQWLALGIQSELGRGGDDMGSQSRQHPNAIPSGSLMPSMTYSKDRARGSSTGKAIL